MKTNLQKTMRLGYSRTKNRYEILNDYTVRVFDEKGQSFLCDPEDWEKLKSNKWSIVKVMRNTFRAMHSQWQDGKMLTFYFHREVFGTTTKTVDHINGDTLDNRKVNLRLCNLNDNMKNRPKQNGAFSSIYKGVTKVPGRAKFYVGITSDKINYSLGYFTDEIVAARAYDVASIKLHKEFANTNFPMTDYLGFDTSSMKMSELEGKKRKKTSKYRGVVLVKRKGNDKWKAALLYKGQSVYIGLFEDEKSAAEAYDVAVLTLDWENKDLNFPRKNYDKKVKLSKMRLF